VKAVKAARIRSRRRIKDDRDGPCAGEGADNLKAALDAIAPQSNDDDAASRGAAGAGLRAQMWAK